MDIKKQEIKNLLTHLLAEEEYERDRKIAEKLNEMGGAMPVPRKEWFVETRMTSFQGDTIIKALFSPDLWGKIRPDLEVRLDVKILPDDTIEDVVCKSWLKQKEQALKDVQKLIREWDFSTDEVFPSAAR